MGARLARDVEGDAIRIVFAQQLDDFLLDGLGNAGRLGFLACRLLFRVGSLVRSRQGWDGVDRGKKRWNQSLADFYLVLHVLDVLVVVGFWFRECGLRILENRRVLPVGGGAHMIVVFHSPYITKAAQKQGCR